VAGDNKTGPLTRNWDGGIQTEIATGVDALYNALTQVTHPKLQNGKTARVCRCFLILEESQQPGGASRTITFMGDGPKENRWIEAAQAALCEV